MVLFLGVLVHRKSILDIIPMLEKYSETKLNWIFF